MAAPSTIEQLTGALAEDFSVTPLVACELEFILHGAAQQSPAQLRQALAKHLQQAGLAMHSVDEERGTEQFEVALLPALPARCVEQTGQLPDLIAEWAKTQNMQADFAAKPSANEYGSGLHVHVDLLDADQHSVFFKQDDAISDSLKYAIGGLLAWMLPCMPVFAPHPQSYARFEAKRNAPLNVSWGANNRTVALRLPDAQGGLRHIEHRVAGADANPAQVIAVILAAIHDGLTSRYEIPEQIYGDASDAQYNLPAFPATLEEAVQMQAASPLHNVITELCS